MFAPAMIIAARQISGRGRGTNQWWSGRGSLTATFVLPAADSSPPHHVPLLAGLAVREAVQGFCDEVPIMIKWPNDLLATGKKIAGLLCERVDGVDLIGVGLNVNTVIDDLPDSLRSRVTAVADLRGQPVGMNDIVTAISGRLAERFVKDQTESFAACLQEYHSWHALVGRTVRISDAGSEPVEGECVGLDGTGRLLVRTVDGTQTAVVAGHVELA